MPETETAASRQAEPPAELDRLSEAGFLAVHGRHLDALAEAISKMPFDLPLALNMSDGPGDYELNRQHYALILYGALLALDVGIADAIRLAHDTTDLLTLRYEQFFRLPAGHA